MRKNQLPQTLVASILLFYCSSIFSQENDRAHYIWFDSQVGMQNSGLANGTRYVESYRIYKGKHQYYQDSKFLKGDLIYSGQPYFDIDLKYDIYKDQLIVAIPYGSDLSIIRLVSKEIQSFTIDNKYFVPLNQVEVQNSPGEELHGFFELMSDKPSLRLFKRNRKTERRRIDENKVYSAFKEANEFYVQKEVQFYAIEKKSDWLKLYPEQKKQINTFYRANRKLMKSDYDDFMKRLCSRIHQLNNQTKKN